jgi:predicted transcriptional regulator
MTPNTTAPSKPAMANLSIKLDMSDRDRIHSLAAYKNRSPHFIMKEAVKNYLEQEEAEQRFVAAAKESRSHYQKTGLHVTHEEFSRWVDELQNNPKTAAPVCHE